MSSQVEFIDQIKTAKTDLHVLALLMQMFDLSEMTVLVAALARVEELAIMQAEKQS